MQRVSTAVALHARGSSGAVLAAFFTLTYVGLGVPAIAAGLLVTYQGLSTAVVEFSLVAAVTCLIALALNMIRRSNDATG
ncbi:hypothetical protein [Rhodococcus sp. W8901]|uniref:hypothetical protein n=1 Tax=Rhodococcus sp. W8901 TaxID=2742603 RepID=UPI0020C5CABB|nr:hypothetical protein [Rhodococcus sp. W8901]